MALVIAFDLDGTLADTLPSITRALNETLAHYGLPALPEERVRLMVGDGAAVLLERAMPAAAPEVRAEALERYTPLLVKTSADARPFPGVPELLARLAADPRVRTAVISNKPHAAAAAFCEAQRLPLNAVLGVGPGLRPKPARDMPDRLAAELGAARLLVVGDSEADWATAAAAGAECVLVGYGFRTPAELRERCGGAEAVPDVAALGRRIDEWLARAQ